MRSQQLTLSGRDCCAELPIRYAFTNTHLELAEREQEPEPEPQPGTVGPATDEELAGLAYSNVDLIVDVLMMLDFVLKFCRAYYDYDYHGQRHLRVRVKEIFKHYLEGALVRDSFACLPLDTLVIALGHPQTASAVRLLRLLRVERVVKFKTAVDGYVDRSVGKGWLRPFVSGISLVLGTMFFNHVLACILYKVGSELYDDPDCHEYENNRCGWVARMQYKPWAETGLLVRYMDAFYFTFTILTTVGFGDITAHSTLERTMTVAAMTAGCAIFGIVMGQITAVIHGMNMGLAHYEERVRELEQYMSFRDVNSTVRERVKRFIVEKYPEKRVYDERAILASLPVGLRTEFLQDMYLEHVSVLPFFPSHDHEVLVGICRIIRQDVIMPGEVVVREGSRLTNVYTVVSGNIAVQVPALDPNRASVLQPADWMLSDQDLLKQNLDWGKLDEDEKKREGAASQTLREAGAALHHPEHNNDGTLLNLVPEQLDDDVVGEQNSTRVHAGGIRKQDNLDIDPEAGGDGSETLDWITLAILKDSHYFCEQCLSYEAPSFKRYTAKHLSTIGAIDKEAMAHLISEYSSVRDSVREYTLVKFEKICARLTRHINGERKLPAAALVDTRFEANMMCRVIEAWGGAQEIKKNKRRRSLEYMSTVEKTYAAFTPSELGMPLSRADVRHLKEKKRRVSTASERASHLPLV